jgi:chloride channel 7
VLIPKVFNIFTVAVKFASCALCVASGLPVGPEGPMIHMGAAIGAALSQGHSTTLGFTTNIFRRFRNPRDKRDFVTAGVAVGVATAFNAPIGGLLFAFEEVASFWKHSLTWQVRGGGTSRGLQSRGEGEMMRGSGGTGVEVTSEVTGKGFRRGPVCGGGDNGNLVERGVPVTVVMNNLR